MRSFWLMTFGGATLLFLADFGTFPTVPVNAADNPEYMPICTLPKCLNPRVTAKSGIGTANATAEAKVAPEDAEKWCATYKPMDKYCAKDQVKNGWIAFRNLFRAGADCVAGRMNAIDGGVYNYVGVWGEGPGKGRAKFRLKGDAREPKWEESGADVDQSGSFLGWGGGSPNLATQWEVLCAGAPVPAAAQPVSQVPQAATPVPNAVQVRQSQLQQFLTEIPQASVDFGTPEATAKIAAKAGFIDVVGVKLGIPMKAAMDTLKAHNPNLTMDPSLTMPPYEALPGVVMTPLFISKKNTDTSGPEKESVGLLVTMAPNEPLVWGVIRELWYEKEDSRPTIETMVAGLRQKYGQETLKDVSNRLIWIYDTQGQQMTEAKAKDVINRCGSVWTAGVGISGGAMRVGDFDRQVVEGYYHGSYGKDPFNGLCHSYSSLQAEFMSQQPIGKISPPLIVNVKVSARNRQLEVSGVTASHTLLMREATKLAEQRKGDAAKREVPKF